MVVCAVCGVWCGFIVVPQRGRFQWGGGVRAVLVMVGVSLSFVSDCTGGWCCTGGWWAVVLGCGVRHYLWCCRDVPFPPVGLVVLLCF